MPTASHNHPIATEVSTEARKRATTISGRPGNATAVATRTIGLIAGADSRNANAAAGATPRRSRPPAIGTDPHSHPGSATPAIPATGTASTARRGSALAKNSGGTNTAMAALITTPRTRNGIACTTIDTNTVAQVRIAGESNRPISGDRATTTTMSNTASTSTGSGRQNRRRPGPGRVAGSASPPTAAPGSAAGAVSGCFARTSSPPMADRSRPQDVFHGTR